MDDVIERRDGLVFHKFKLGEAPLIYSDAVIRKEEDYALLSAEDIETIKQTRYNNWLAVINTPPEE